MATFTNRATLTYNGNVRNSNIATGELVEVLSVSKTAVVGEYGAFDEITYVVSIVNSGTTAFNGLTVTDTLGAYTFDTSTLYPLTYVDGSIKYYVNGVLLPAPTVSDTTGELVISGINVPAGGNAIIVYQATTNDFAPLDSTSSITNTVTVDGETLSSPITASETVTALDEPDLTINKSISPSVVPENSRVTYTFTILNYGNTPADAADNAVVTDTFDPILTDIVVTFNGTVWTEGTEYTYDEATGVFATVAGNITVPAATYTQDPATGEWITTPGVSTLTVEGTI